MFDNLQFASEGTVALVTLDRPQSLNALNTALLQQLRQAIRQAGDDASIRTVIITGSGQRAFAAGADIRELASMGPLKLQQHARFGQEIFGEIEQLGKPVIAAINGVALGGGCELALACTLRVASETAQFGQPEVNLGLIPGFGATQRLPRLVGRGRALDLLLTGRVIDATEAFRIGLADRVTPASSLLDEARALAQLLSGKAPVAVRAALEAVRRGAEMPLAEGQALEASLFGLVGASTDMREGVHAFLEKRPPVFKGE
jgi:enoyl-CoA hydratase